MSFYYYVGAKHGKLQVLIQTVDQSTEVWRNSTQPQKHETWLQTVITFFSNHSFQVLIRGQLSADSEASGVLAIDDLSFSPGCVTLPESSVSPPPSLPSLVIRLWHWGVYRGGQSV
ncbi:MAM and LDL-receptor class A domain-containing protein 1 [Larimichthys crocea]|uniref:Uncharacterized protein n=1 Tax=Larimichthys crocea TaxID=215358 RepID=A0ACD3RAG6_LARCR|nr:MAM and LDL-receptor class A domain-containing protein 1 [Larimichthys crocea]